MKRLLLTGTILTLTMTLVLSPSPAMAAVELSDFFLDIHAGYIELTWETATEYDNLGFHIRRGTNNNVDQTEQINASMIPSVASGQPVGATYTIQDNNVTPDTVYYYWLVAVDFDGRESKHGPITGLLESGVGINNPTPATGASPIPTAVNIPDIVTTPLPSATRVPPTVLPQPTQTAVVVMINTHTPTPLPTSTPIVIPTNAFATQVPAITKEVTTLNRDPNATSAPTLTPILQPIVDNPVTVVPPTYTPMSTEIIQATATQGLAMVTIGENNPPSTAMVISQPIGNVDTTDTSHNLLWVGMGGVGLLLAGIFVFLFKHTSSKL